VHILVKSGSIYVKPTPKLITTNISLYKLLIR